MEFEGLSEQIEWEARRVAAAFELRGWEKMYKLGERQVFEAVYESGVMLDAVFVIGDSTLKSVDIRNNKDSCQSKLYGSLQAWRVYKSHYVPAFNELMMRGLFRLGIDETLLVPLEHPLSAHEKLELRLSLPREFWPKTWLDEEQQ
jgi:hypothetical protein